MLKSLQLLCLILIIFLYSCNFEKKKVYEFEYSIESFKFSPDSWKETKLGNNMLLYIPIDWKNKVIPDSSKYFLLASFIPNCGLKSKLSLIKNEIKLLGEGDVLDNYSSNYYKEIKKTYSIKEYSFRKIIWANNSIVLGNIKVDDNGKIYHFSTCFAINKNDLYDFTYIISADNSCDESIFNKIVFNTKIDKQYLINTESSPISTEKLISPNE